MVNHIKHLVNINLHLEVSVLVWTFPRSLFLPHPGNSFFPLISLKWLTIIFGGCKVRIIAYGRAAPPPAWGISPLYLEQVPIKHGVEEEVILWKPER